VHVCQKMASVYPPSRERIIIAIIDCDAGRNVIVTRIIWGIVGGVKGNEKRRRNLCCNLRAQILSIWYRNICSTDEDSFYDGKRSRSGLYVREICLSDECLNLRYGGDQTWVL